MDLIKRLMAFLVLIFIYAPNSYALSCSDYPNPTACAAALGQVDPRNLGAKCLGTTWSGGTPHQIGSNDDTAGFVAAEFIASASGAAVMVPDGCWVQNLPMLNGVTFIGQNWAPNYGYDYGNGSIGYTLNVTKGTGYTNGTYLLQASGTVGGPSTCTVSGNNCFNLGLKIGNGVSSTASLPIQTGSTGAFTVTSHTALSASTPVLIYDSTSVSNGTAANYMFGAITADTGTSMTVNVTQIAGSGSISTWNITNSNYIIVSGNSFGVATPTGYQINQPGLGYNSTVSIPIPSAAGAGNGASIGIAVRPNGAPFAKPVLYTIGHPTDGININGAETVSLVGFEVNAFSDSSAMGITNCIGDDSASQGFGGKIWLYQMSMKGCNTGFSGSSSCFDFLVSQNTDYGANNTGINGCFSDFLSQGDTFASGATGIAGSGGGFARVQSDRFEYLTTGISPGNNAFLELSIVNSQFDHFDQCAINLGYQWNQITMTGGALKAGGVDGSLTVTGSVLSGTDGTQTAGSTTYTTTSESFTSNMVGSILTITSCTGTGCVDAGYIITTFIDSHDVTLDRTATNGVNNITASTFNVGAVGQYNTSGQIEMQVTSAVGSIHGGQTATAAFRKVPTIIDTSASSITIGTGAQTFTTALSDGLHSRITATDGAVNAGSTTFTSPSQTFTGGNNIGDVLNITSCSGTGCINGFYRIVAFTSTHVVVLDRTPTDGLHNMTSAHFTSALPLLIYDTGTQTNWMYGTVTSDSGTSLVMNITSVGGSGTFGTWTFGRPYWINVGSVGGTTEANGINQIVTVADGTHIVLQNTTWANAWTSGGFGGVQTLDANICLGQAGVNGGNKANQLTLSNVEFASSEALGQPMAPIYIIESSMAGGGFGDYIGIYGSSLIKYGTANVSVNYTSYALAAENWIVAPPTHYFRQALGLPAIITPEIAGGAIFTISGCSATNPLGGSAAGQFTSGTSGTCTPTITITDVVGNPAPNGWACYGTDLNSGVSMTQTATTTTTVTLSGASTSGDIHNFSCIGY